MYIVMAPLAGAFGGLLASGILSLPSFGSLHTWRMIFAIEGIITCGLSVIAFIVLTDRPSSARWLSKEQKDLAIARVKSERLASTEVLDGFDVPKILRGLMNPVVIASGLIFMFASVPGVGLTFFAPTIIKTIYPLDSTVVQQLKTVPPYAVGAFFTMLFPYLSMRLNRIVPMYFIMTPMIIVGYIIFLASHDATAKYAALYLIASGTYGFGAMCNGHSAANVVSDTSRSTALGMTVVFGNLGGMVSTWSFVSTDAPDYPIGNGLNEALAISTLIVAVGLFFFMRWDNKRRQGRDIDAELSGLSPKQIQDLDWKHPAFRWKI